MRNFDSRIPVEAITAGKLRRYHSLALWRQLLRPKTIVLPNLRDFFLVLAGIVQSTWKLLRWRPDVVFTKGGYVCLPVGIAAKLLRIPLVIHDSDAHPGLTNRILARWATQIATGAPLKYYTYPKDRTSYVGIPIDSQFTRSRSLQERQAQKRELGFDPERPLLVVTGGGLGAKRLNDIVMAARLSLTKLASLVLISGAAQYDELRTQVPKDDRRFVLRGFVSNGMADLLGTADVVVARAGATTILELAALATPTILVPNEYLTGGHQLKNAKIYADAHAAIVLTESDLEKQPEQLTKTIQGLVNHPAQTAAMAQRFLEFSRPQAARDMAALITKAVKGS